MKKDAKTRQVNENEGLEQIKLSLMEKELLLKEVELLQKKRRFGVFEAGIIVAIIGLLSNALVTYLNGRNEFQLEQQKFKANLILQAVGSDDMELNKKNLKFLADMGFVDVTIADSTKISFQGQRNPVIILSDLSTSPPTKHKMDTNTLKALIERYYLLPDSLGGQFR